MSVICPVLLSHRITFFFLGIASLIGWNAILTAMTFFSMYYPKELYGDVTFLFPIPLFFANFIWGLVTPKISQHFSLQYRISFCLAAVAFFMICLPIITVYLSNPTGFTLCLITIFIIGSFNSIASNSIVGLVAQVHPSLAGLFWVSTAISGLLMNIASATILALFNDTDEGKKTGAIFYFSIAAILTILAISSQNVFVQSPYYQNILLHHTQNNNENEDQSSVVSLTSANTKSDYTDDISTSLTKQTNNQSSLLNQLKDYVKLVKKTLKQSGYVPLFIWIIYVQTFMLYPGVSVFSKPSYHYLSKSWSLLIMLTLCNVCDVIGKFMSNYPFYNIPFLYSLVCFRFTFFFTFLMTLHHSNTFIFGNDLFAYFNMLLFAFTNGFITAGLMILGPQRSTNSKTSELIAFINSFSLSFGIACGSILAPTLAL